MIWLDIACVVFVCVTANHLGLIKTVEDVTGYKIPILNCVKCSAFWSVFFCCIVFRQDIIFTLAISFLSSYVAIWLELLEGFIDYLFKKFYEKIYSDSEHDEDSADA